MNWLVTKSLENTDSGLGAVEAGAPTQLTQDKRFGVTVSLWCGRERFSLPIKEGSISRDLTISIGFRQGDLNVTPKGGRISLEEALWEVRAEGLERISASNITNTNSDQKTGFDAEASLTAKREVQIGGVFSAGIQRTSSAEKSKKTEVEMVFHQRTVIHASPNTWRIFGEGASKDGVLEFKVLNNEHICSIDTTEPEIELEVNYTCDRIDLQVDVVEDPKNAFFFKRNTWEARNQERIAGIVVAKGLSSSCLGSNTLDSDTQICLSRHLLAGTFPTIIAN